MVSGPITSWQIDGEKLETGADFILGDSEITADGDCSHELTFGPWKESYDKPRQRIKKQRHHFVNKSPYSSSYDFSSCHVSVWELDDKESWAPKNWCFDLWCWRRLLRVPCTARRSNQSILKESTLNIHQKHWCWSWSSSNLATWCEVSTCWKRPWC